MNLVEKTHWIKKRLDVLKNELHSQFSETFFYYKMINDFFEFFKFYLTRMIWYILDTIIKFNLIN